MKTNYETAVEYRKQAKIELGKINRGIRLQVYSMTGFNDDNEAAGIHTSINFSDPNGFLVRASRETWMLIGEALGSQEVGELVGRVVREKIYSKAKRLGDAARSEAEGVLMEGGLE